VGIRFIQRDQTNAICGDYARLQPGIAEEEIDEASPEFVAYRAGPAPDPRIAQDVQEAEADKQDAQILATLNMTDAQIAAAINSAFPDPAQRAVIKRLARLAQHAARGRKLR